MLRSENKRSYFAAGVGLTLFNFIILLWAYKKFSGQYIELYGWLWAFKWALGVLEPIEPSNAATNDRA